MMQWLDGMDKRGIIWLLLILILMLLSACGAADNQQVQLPLADDKASFLFFYTDN